MIFNTHTHFNFILKNPVCPIANTDYLEKFKRQDLQEILIQNKEYWIGFCCIVWSNELSSENALEVAKMDKSFYCTLWLHPEDHQEEELLNKIDSIIENFEKLIQKNKQKIIGIWEIGLDYHYLDEENEIHKNRQKEIQKIFFERQIKLANKYNLPVIIHSRDSKADTFKCLKKFVPNKFVVHCYSENLEFAKQIIELSPNSFIGFAGMITYKNAENIREVIKNIPLKRILVETDDPFLAPQEFRWQTNYPAYVKLVLDKVKELREENAEIVENTIWQNSLNFFNLKTPQI